MSIILVGVGCLPSPSVAPVEAIEITPTQTTPLVSQPDQAVRSSNPPPPVNNQPGPAAGAYAYGQAAVESIEVRLVESFPVQVQMVARGSLPDSCTEIDQALIERNGNTFQGRLTTRSRTDQMCAQAVVPFEEVIPLDVSGLPPGQYTVNVNGLVDSFTLPAAKGPAAAPPPEPVEPLPTPTPLSSGQGGFTRVQIYLVALGDNGQSGQKIGCDDSLIAVERGITPTIAPLRASLNELLSLREQYDGQSGLYNALYQSDLKIDDIGLANGLATIYLSGRYTLGGVCDIPRFEAQLEATALQFSTVDRVMIFLNGQAMTDALSLAGTTGTPPPGN
ncbi:MAG: hypothetical protein BroJett011_48030 [Chloroflexota bacterium]|nr:MAG: hypothetical protein BroJett011_48030 [Chloroflexota bacterium]